MLWKDIINDQRKRIEASLMQCPYCKARNTRRIKVDDKKIRVAECSCGSRFSFRTSEIERLLMEAIGEKQCH